MCYPLQIRTANKGGSIEGNFPKGEKIWCYRTAVPLHARTTHRGGSIAPNFPKSAVSENLVLPNRYIFENRDNEGRFDSTKFSEWFPFKKFGAIEPLRCCVTQFSTANAVGQHHIFASGNFSAIEPLRCCASHLSLQLLTTNRGGSIAPNFPKGVVSENLVLPNRCIFRKQRQRRAVRYHQVF